MIKKLTGSLNNFFVSSYKLVGFVALTLILFGLVSYVVVNVFYLVNSSWVAPVILTQNHAKVMEAKAKLLSQRLTRDRLRVEKLEYQVERKDLDRLIQLNEAFQTRFDEALASDLLTQQIKLERVFSLKKELDATERDIEKSQSAYKDLTRDRLQQDLKAGLISKDDFVNGTYTLSRVEQSELSLIEKKVKVESEATGLRQAIRALQATRTALEDGQFDASEVDEVDYDTLIKQQQYQRSVRELLQAAQRRELVQQKIDLVERSIEGYDSIIDALESSPFFGAFDKQITVAFVPYENLEDVSSGEPVYGCALELVWCSKVGTVGTVLDGEVTANHPLRNRQMRGVMVEMKLDEQEWAKERSLHVGRAPFLF